MKCELIHVCELQSNVKWRLLYRGSENKFNWSEFHDKCDDCKPTLMIVKTSDGSIFGRYTTANYASAGWTFDRDAFLFCLKSNSLESAKYRVEYPGNALFNLDKTCGPNFGSHDLAFYSDRIFTTLNSTVKPKHVSMYGVPFKPKEFKIATEIIDIEVYEESYDETYDEIYSQNTTLYQ